MKASCPTTFRILLRRTCIFTLFLISFGNIIFCQNVWSQVTGKEKISIPRLSGEVQLDGQIEDEEWQNAREVPMTQHSPNFEGKPSQETEILIGYTDDYLYAACNCYDQGEPADPSFKRDLFTSDADWFALILDTFNDEQNGLAFGTTPSGLRTDFAIYNDATASGNAPPVDLSWNSFWDVEVQKNKRGWFAEMRIPFSSLRFEVEDGNTDMGIIFWRTITRNNEVNTYPEIPNNWGFFSSWKPSQAKTAEFQGLESDPPLRVTPYVLGGLGQEYQLNDQGNDYEIQNNPTFDGGLDVKYGLTSNLTLDITVNTDFAQVEADNQQVNLTRFPLFFPEKRRFFKERSSNFAFDFQGQNRLFYSRRIGLYEGNQVRILGGARMVGRKGPWDIGILNLQTAREPDIGPDGAALPSENFGVARFKRNVINEDSRVGGMVTSRVGLDGKYHLGYGMDGLFRVQGQDFVSLKWAQTFDETGINKLNSLAPSRMEVLWEDRSFEGLNYGFRYGRAGRRYNPELGFEFRENYFRIGDRIGYGWIMDDNASIERHRLNFKGVGYFRNTDGSLQSLKMGPTWQVVITENQDLKIGASHVVEDLQDTLWFSENVNVPTGRYAFQTAKAFYKMPSGPAFRATFNATAGNFYDGHRGTFQVAPTWNPSRYITFSGFYQLNRLVFPERSMDLNAHVGRIRLLFTPNVEFSVMTFIQYNSLTDSAVGNLRFRYNPRQGNDLYLVVNEQLNTGPSGKGNGIKPPMMENRTFLVKYTYTFNW